MDRVGSVKIVVASYPTTIRAASFHLASRQTFQLRNSEPAVDDLRGVAGELVVRVLALAVATG
jgi:hypothetical protein